MSEYINNQSQRKELLRHLLIRLHEGENPEILRNQLVDVLKSIPYNDVVEVEQELINNKILTEDEILQFCDLHTAVLDGAIDLKSAKEVPAGHPVDTFKRENLSLRNETEKYTVTKQKIEQDKNIKVSEAILQLRTIFNNLSDIDKHYKRKEFLLFPFLEKHQITGPPKVMWGKHDETRSALKTAHTALSENIDSVDKLKSVITQKLDPVIDMIEGMIMKEEEILFPMSMDTLTEQEWFKIYEETPEFGYSLFDPTAEWKPENIVIEKQEYIKSDAIRLSSGGFSTAELEALFVHLPIDITFVDKDDKVRFFSHSPKRIFERNRSIIGRDVRMCHPPGSVHIVEQIMNDFKSGKENKAAFWLSNFMGRFIYIEYSAVRDTTGEYLGVVEVTQDITQLRKLEGDQRLLSYEKR